MALHSVNIRIPPSLDDVPPVEIEAYPTELVIPLRSLPYFQHVILQIDIFKEYPLIMSRHLERHISSDRLIKIFAMDQQ